MTKLKVRALRNKTEVFAKNEDNELETLEVNNDGELKTTGLKSSDLTFNSNGALEVTGISGGGGGSDYTGVYNRVFNETITGLSDSSQVFDIGSLKTIFGIFNMSTTTHTTANILIEASIGLVGNDYNWFTVINQNFIGEPLVFDFTGRYYKYTLTLTAPSNNLISQFSILLREEAVVEVSNFPLTDDGRLLVSSEETSNQYADGRLLVETGLDRQGYNNTLNYNQVITEETNTNVLSFETSKKFKVKIRDINIPPSNPLNFTFSNENGGLVPIGETNATMEWNGTVDDLDYEFWATDITFNVVPILENTGYSFNIDIVEIIGVENPSMNFSNGALSVNVDNFTPPTPITIPREAFVYSRLINEANFFDISSYYVNFDFRYVVPAGKRFVWTKVLFILYDEGFGLGEGISLNNGIRLRAGETVLAIFRYASELQRFFKSVHTPRDTENNDRYFYEHVFNPPLLLEVGENPNIFINDDLSSISVWQWNVEGYLID